MSQQQQQQKQPHHQFSAADICTQAKDEFFACLEKVDGKLAVPTEHSASAKLCLKQAEQYFEKCPEKWRAFFNKQREREVVQGLHNSEIVGKRVRVEQRERPWYHFTNLGSGNNIQYKIDDDPYES